MTWKYFFPHYFAGLINSLMFTGESIAMKVLEPNRKHGEVGSRLNTFLAGSAGGVLQCTVLVPSEVIKVAMQTTALHAQTASGEAAAALTGNAFDQTRQTIQQIYRAEGFKGFYKGLGATAVRDIPSIGIYFFIYKNARDMLGKLEARGAKAEPGTVVVPCEPSSFATIMAGGLAGTLSWFLIYPLDVIKTVTQVSTAPVAPGMKAYKDMNSIEVGVSLFRQYGIQSFYRGLGPTLLRAFPVNATTFYFYELFKVMLDGPAEAHAR
jgi:solute carrier family 25 carnitine/acylcarnitine transporter 20/29